MAPDEDHDPDDPPPAAAEQVRPIIQQQQQIRHWCAAGSRVPACGPLTPINAGGRHSTLHDHGGFPAAEVAARPPGPG